MRAADLAQVEAVIVVGIVIGALGLIVASAVHDTKWLPRLRPWLIPAAAVIAIGATAGSLWFSEVAHFPPCKLCWYQRIAMYPLALVLTIAAVRRDKSIVPYALSIAAAGLAVNLWHLYVETFPQRITGGCDAANPCTIRWVEAFGFWTIPRLASACFFGIAVCLACSRERKETIV